MMILESISALEADALANAAAGAFRGVMNYYVGRHRLTGEYRVFDGRDWLWGRGTLSFAFLWAVWPDGTLIQAPGQPTMHPLYPVVNWQERARSGTPR